MTGKKSSAATVLSLAQLLEQQPATPPPCLVEPGLLPPQGILFVGGEPKVGKSLLVANLALSLASGSHRTGFSIPAPRRVLVCQFELPVPQFVDRLATMRKAIGTAADQNLLIDTRATGHLLSAPQGMNHFLSAAQSAAAEVIILDPLYSTHDQDENDTRCHGGSVPVAAASARCFAGRAHRGASCPQIHHALRDRQRLSWLQRAACRGRQLYAAHQAFSPTVHRGTALPVPLCRCAAAATAPTRSADSLVFFQPASRPPLAVAAAQGGKGGRDTSSGGPWRSRLAITNCASKSWIATECSKRTAQLAISEACQQGWIVQDNGQYRLPL